MVTARHRRFRTAQGLPIVVVLTLSALALGGGTPENMLLILDPASADSLYIGNYYKNARNVPDANVVYMTPDAPNYAAFANTNLPELFGFLANAGLDDHIDYIVVMPGSSFYVSASGLITDGCYPVNRFSISSCYTMAFIADAILAGGLSSTEINRYYSTADADTAFASSTAWLAGAPSTDPNARRYFIGAMLGYTGSRGNTLAEIIAMIDRSVAVDGTRPVGTFYYMNNPADPNRNVRSPQYATAVTKIVNYSGQAEVIGTTDAPAVLPIGRHDCQGIMTGASDPPIDGADMTILPGSFCDHLTSWAAMFDNASQVKLSRWIANGASGSWGATEEPCNYTGKFPAAKFHLHYWRGASLGEAALRNAQYTPFQMLLYGDPMTRAYSYLPTVYVDDAPTGPVGGVITLTPTATTTHPTAQIVGFDLFIDGRLSAEVAPGEAFTVDTALLADGWHDLRVRAYDNAAMKRTGRWLGSLTVNNSGRSVSMNAGPASGDWSTPFSFGISSSGAHVREVRVVQNGRVVAAAPGPAANLTVAGRTLGAGPISTHAEALLNDGTIVRSPASALTVAYAAGTPSGQPPVAFSYIKRVRGDQPFVVELPASFDNSAQALTFTILGGPAHATPAAGQTGAFRLMRPAPGAAGIDHFTFQVTSAAGSSNVATVTLAYDYWFADMNCDGLVNNQDIDGFILALFDPSAYATAFPSCNVGNADCNNDGLVNNQDIDGFIDALFGP